MAHSVVIFGKKRAIIRSSLEFIIQGVNVSDLIAKSLVINFGNP
jgi:hypothetical protein